MDVSLEIKAAPKTASEASRDRQNTGPEQNKGRRWRDVSRKPVLPKPYCQNPALTWDVWDELPSFLSIFEPGVCCWLVEGFLSKIFC